MRINSLAVKSGERAFLAFAAAPVEATRVEAAPVGAPTVEALVIGGRSFHDALDRLAFARSLTKWRFRDFGDSRIDNGNAGASGMGHGSFESVDGVGVITPYGDVGLSPTVGLDWPVRIYNGRCLGRCSAIPHRIPLAPIVRWNSTVPYRTVPYRYRYRYPLRRISDSTIHYGIVPYGTVPYCTVIYCVNTVLHTTAGAIRSLNQSNESLKHVPSNVPR